MKVEYYPYTLTLNKGGKKSEGALLKIALKDGEIGYADCHPWVTLGDDPLEQQLNSILTGLFTPLIRQSIVCACLDGEARAKKQSLFDDIAIPASQLLIHDASILTKNVLQEYCQKQIKTIKIKELPSRTLLESFNDVGMRLRIDLNERGKIDEITSFLDSYAELLQCVDFIEDPFPFDLELWTAMQRDYNISLACDRWSEHAVGNYDAAHYLVYKPAKQAFQIFAGKNILQKIVLTSYMDHPVGQHYAAFLAAKFASQIDSCGILTHGVYSDDPFIERVKTHGPYLIPVAGTGLGFDDLLNTLSWKTLL